MINLGILASIVFVGLCRGESNETEKSGRWSEDRDAIWWWSDELERAEYGAKKYYTLGRESLPYHEAREYCAARQATLWCPRNDHENNLVYYNLQDENNFEDDGTTWIGIKRNPIGNKDDPNSYRCDCRDTDMLAGIFTGFSNQKCDGHHGGDDMRIDYTQWQPGEPNNFGGPEHCISTLDRNENWFDVPCETHWARPLCMTISPGHHNEKRELNPDKVDELRKGAAATAAIAALLGIFFATFFGFCFYCYCCYGCFCCGCAPCKKSGQAPNQNNGGATEAQQPAAYTAPPAPAPAYAPPQPAFAPPQPVYAAPPVAYAAPAPMFQAAPMPCMQAAPMNITINSANTNTNTN